MPYADPTKAKEYAKEYYKKNKERQLKLSKNYYYNNIKKVSNRHKEWYKKNKDHVKEYYLENREHKLKRLKEYYYENWEKKQIQRKEWIEKNKEKHREWLSVYHKKYRKKINHAHVKVYRALKSGELKRIEICEHCKTNMTEHAHHEDYSKPLEVTWLCRNCHVETHKRRKSNARFFERT